jgi:hypothetical protein
MHELLAVTNDTDLRVLSYFQGALSRKLRRLLGDREKKIHLIGWDYETTEWDAQHNMIVGGVCYLTEATVRSLRECFVARDELDALKATEGNRDCPSSVIPRCDEYDR